MVNVYDFDDFVKQKQGESWLENMLQTPYIGRGVRSFVKVSNRGLSEHAKYAGEKVSEQKHELINQVRDYTSDWVEENEQASPDDFENYVDGVIKEIGEENFAKTGGASAYLRRYVADHVYQESGDSYIYIILDQQKSNEAKAAAANAWGKYGTNKNNIKYLKKRILADTFNNQ